MIGGIHMKKAFALLLTMILVLSLVACDLGSNTNTNNPPASTPTNSTEQQPNGSAGNEEVQKPAGTDGIRPEFKQAMDSYEKFFDEYVAFMKKFKEAEDTTSMLGEYTTMMQQYTQTMADLNKIDEGSLSDAEALYYADVMLRINQKLLQVA